MKEPVDPELRDLANTIEQRRLFERSARPLADVIGQLFAKRGYAQFLSTQELESAWSKVASPGAADSRPGVVRRGVLEVVVKNSAVLQELTFHQKRIVAELAAALPDFRIRRLRFRVGEVD